MQHHKKKMRAKIKQNTFQQKKKYIDKKNTKNECTTASALPIDTMAFAVKMHVPNKLLRTEMW